MIFYLKELIADEEEKTRKEQEVTTIKP